MNYYATEVERIRKETYSNQWQIDTVIGIRHYMDNHYDSDINLDVLSRIRWVSKYHLLRLFKRYYGQTPNEYLRSKRIQKSKECLKKGMSVTETCFAVGFKSLGSFSVLFKNRTGMTPVEYRKEQFSRNNEC